MLEALERQLDESAETATPLSIEMNDLLRPRIAVAANDRLSAWDAEGGSPAVAGEERGSGDGCGPPIDGVLLERLGAAVLEQWHLLPTPLRRAIYKGAAREETNGEGAPFRRRLARLLHEHAARLHDDAPASSSRCTSIAGISPGLAADRWPPLP